MQGHVKMDGFDFEPIDEQRSRCSVCQKVINKLLQKAHANIHSSLLTAKIDINKLPSPPIQEISQVKGVKKTSTQFEEHVNVGLDPKRPVLCFDDILLHSKNLKKPEVNYPASQVQNLILKKLNPITDKNQQGQGNERTNERFSERQNDIIDKRTGRGLTTSVVQPETQKPGIQIDNISRLKERELRESSVQAKAILEDKKSESASKILIFEKMLNSTCSQNQVCLPQKNALERPAEIPAMKKKQKTSSVSFYIKKYKECEYYIQRLVKINAHSIYIRTLKAMRTWKKFNR